MGDSDELICGGYLLGKLRTRADWREGDLLSKCILSASRCWTDGLPDYGDFGPTDQESERFAMLHLGLTEPGHLVQAVRAHLWTLLRNDQLEYPDVFLSPDAARTFLPLLGGGDNGVVLFSISTKPPVVRTLAELDGGKAFGHSAVLARNLAPLPGKVLGWEVLGHEPGTHGFHSWLCGGAHIHAERAFGIRPNADGFVDSLEDAQRVADYCNVPNNAEPGYWAPWQIRRYPLT